jgi:hypothetical protein
VRGEPNRPMLQTVPAAAGVTINLIRIR